MKTAAEMNWNPYQIFVWTTDQLQQWFDTYGSWGQYDGRMWKPKIVHLGVERYEVSFREFVPE